MLIFSSMAFVFYFINFYSYFYYFLPSTSLGFKTFFMRTILKVFYCTWYTIASVVYDLVFRPWGTGDLYSLTREWVCTPCIGKRSLNHWTTRKVPPKLLIQCIFKTSNLMNLVKSFAQLLSRLVWNQQYPWKKVDPKAGLTSLDLLDPGSILFHCADGYRVFCFCS